MGFWDALCPLCGVSSCGGPHQLAAEDSEADVKAIVPNLRELCKMTADDDTKLEEIVKDGFSAALGNDGELPPGYGSRDYSTSFIAVGYWGLQGDFDSYRVGPSVSSNAFTARRSQMLIPDGRGVQVLRVRHSDGYGADFKYVVTVTKLGEEKEVRRDICCHPAGPSMFLCEHCYFYLEKWVNWEELPDRRIAFPNDPEPLHFPGELYEVINSRKQTLGMFSSCTRACDIVLISSTHRNCWNSSSF